MATLFPQCVSVIKEARFEKHEMFSHFTAYHSIQKARIVLLLAGILSVLPPLNSLYAQQGIYTLDDVERIGASALKGPEDVAVDSEGNIFTGCADGVLYKITPQGDVSRFAATGGRPLGLYFSPDGELLVCDAGRREVLSVTPHGVVRVIARSADNRDLVFPDDIWAARDGTVYFTDATTYPFGEEIQDLIRGEPLGRLLCIRPDKTVEVLKKDLYFPNGVTLSQDETYLYVAETPKARVLRIALSGPGKGESQVFVDNLPGFIDGIAMDHEGNILVAIPAISEKDRKRVEALPIWVRGWLSRLPRWSLPTPAPEGMVLRIRSDKTVEILLSDPKGEKIPSVTNVISAGGFYYMGFLYYGDGIARIRR